MRKNGVLMHISSLCSKHGIGDMGIEAYRFIDFLKESLQAYWQILPICPTSYGDSPYQSYSTYAGNPYFIDLDELSRLGLLKSSDYEDIDYEDSKDKINFGALYRLRYPILKKAVSNFDSSRFPDYEDFISNNAYWLDDYALFMSLKDAHNGKSWWEWDEAYRFCDKTKLNEFSRTHTSDLEFWKVIQYLFFRQWFKLKQYAHDNSISIIGDLPIYVSLDSVDVWINPKQFQLNDDKLPVEVAGCPPDGFSKDGQLWGNPLFNWEYMEADGFSYWIQKIKYLCNLYDVLRIDHFRGFDSYYAIPYGATDARTGVWKQGPGMKLFNRLKSTIGEQRIIVEDLGFLTDSVKTLLNDSGFPGMKVLQMGFDSRDPHSKEYLPHKIIEHCIAYTGSHDNDTVIGWFEQASKEDVAFAKSYLNIRDDNQLNWDMISALMRSPAMLSIIQAQDLLGLGSGSRMNTPSTIGSNWTWRATQRFGSDIAEKLKQYTIMYERN